jgi:phosphonopyruvate decarboxylase
LLSCEKFFSSLKAKGFEFFSGVPDSLLKNFCFYVSDHLPADQHVICANEGSAVGLAAGYHLATGKIPVVYLQNSGLGNTVNPLLSLCDPDVYSIPVLLIIGWRGEPGVKDEPQHVKQGRVMTEVLEALEIPYGILGPDSDISKVLSTAEISMREKSAPYALLVKSDTFGDYELKKIEKTDFTLSREEAINLVLEKLASEDVVISTTGKTSRELYELRKKRHEESRADFLTVGSMGHSSQIALGIALQKPDRRVVCIDGDGSLLMHLGGLATIGRLAPRGFIHIVINNGAHESVGGQPTGAFQIDLIKMAQATNYKSASSVASAQDFTSALEKTKGSEGPHFIEIKVKQGSRKDLGRPKSTPLENKLQFMRALDL